MIAINDLDLGRNEMTAVSGGIYVPYGSVSPISYGTVLPLPKKGYYQPTLLGLNHTRAFEATNETFLSVQFAHKNSVKAFDNLQAVAIG